MIIFYEKATGKIVGTIDGRIHGQEHAKMWIGNKDETDRLVIQWKSIGKKVKTIEREVEIGEAVDDDGFFQPITKRIKEKIEVTESEPNIENEEQKEIFKILDKNSMAVYDFIVDVKSKRLIKK